MSQVLHAGMSFYLAIFPDQFSNLPEAAVASATKPRLCFWTNDAEVYRGRWKNLGVAEVMYEEPIIPEYRCIVGGQECVVRHDGEVMRPFISHRDGNLSLKSSCSPLLIEDAANALMGEGKWLPIFDKMLIA
jgi:hypothetical protein